jgi:hypothetical protein
MFYDVWFWIDRALFDGPDVTCRVIAGDVYEAARIALRLHGLSSAPYVSVQRVEEGLALTDACSWGPVFAKVSKQSEADG